MEVKIKSKEGLLEATIEMIDGVMVVSPKGEKFVPKEGDIVTNVFQGVVQGTGIFDYEEQSETWIHVYINLNNELCTDGYLGDVDDLRPATEEEKEKLFKALAEKGLAWDVEKRELVQVKWTPKVGEDYYTPSFNEFEFVPYLYGWDRDETDLKLSNKGWVFQDQTKCQEFCNRLNQAIENIKP